VLEVYAVPLRLASLAALTAISGVGVPPPIGGYTKNVTHPPCGGHVTIVLFFGCYYKIWRVIIIIYYSPL